MRVQMILRIEERHERAGVDERQRRALFSIASLIASRPASDGAMA